MGVADPTPEQAKAGVLAEVAADPRGPREALDRRHIEQLRAAGCTREEVTTLATNLLGEHLGRVVADDLDSYGPWAGDA